MEITLAVAKPSSFPTDMPTLLLRSLSEPVGRTVSFFKYKLAMPILAPSFGAGSNGVLPSPSETIDERFSTGRKSDQRQIDKSRLWRMRMKSLRDR